MGLLYVSWIGVDLKVDVVPMWSNLQKPRAILKTDLLESTDPLVEKLIYEMERGLPVEDDPRGANPPAFRGDGAAIGQSRSTHDLDPDVDFFGVQAFFVELNRCEQAPQGKFFFPATLG